MNPTQLYDTPLYSEIRHCEACPLRQEARRPVPGEGPLTAPIAFIGQNPGDKEDKDGRPFIGDSGDEFDDWLRVMRINRTRVYVTNLVKCHTTRNRPPLKTESAICRNQWLGHELALLPAVQVLIPLGKTASEAVLSDVTTFPKRKLPTGLDAYWVRVRWPETGREFTVLPLPHPAFLLRAPGLREQLYRSTLPVVVAYLRKYFPEVYEAATY